MIKNVKVFEIIMFIALITAYIMVYLIGDKSFQVELLIFGMILSISYMFFGYYFIGKHSIIFSIVSGIVYSISSISIIMCSINLFGAIFMNIVSVIGLIPVLIISIINLKKGDFETRINYHINQLIRVSIFFVINFSFLIINLINH